MKRRIFMFLSAMSLVPFCELVVLYLFHEVDRSVYTRFVNEPLRKSDQESPNISLRGYPASVCMEASLGFRHIVVNVSWGWLSCWLAFFPCHGSLALLLGCTNETVSGGLNEGDRVAVWSVIAFIVATTFAPHLSAVQSAAH